MPTMRAFIAIDLSDEARAVLHEVSDALASQTPDGAVKWVHPLRMHLTLRFLGDTASDRLERVQEAMDRVTAQQPPFTLVLDSLGRFPHKGKPRVIWVGLGGMLEPLHALRGALDDVLQPLGWDREERPFHPHLTLGRVKDRGAVIDLPWGQGVAPAEVTVAELILFESRLRPEGPHYVVQHTSSLGA